MDVQDKLTEITRLVEDARAMPMSASCLVNREEVLGLLDELRSLLPEQLHQADTLLNDRDAVVDEGRDAARRLMDQARAEHDRLVEEQSVVIGARERAALIITEANAESTRLLSDADDYVDRKLAEFEIALDKLTQQVQRGRVRLNERRAADLGRLGPGGAHAAGNATADEALPEEAETARNGIHRGRSGPDGQPPAAGASPERPSQGAGDAPDLRTSGLGEAPPLG